jgi:nitroreductase
MTRFLRDLRQVRQYRPDAIPEDVLMDILEVARWSGSAKNVQPWHFIVIRDRETLQGLSELGNYTSFIKGAPLAIAVVLDGKNPRTEWFDEGRVEERMMLAAKAHGIGSGTAWYAEGAVNELLGVPEAYVVRSVVGFGYPADRSQAESSVHGGRKPLADLVRYERFESDR